MGCWLLKLAFREPVFSGWGIQSRDPLRSSWASMGDQDCKLSLGRIKSSPYFLCETKERWIAIQPLWSEVCKVHACPPSSSIILGLLGKYLLEGRSSRWMTGESGMLQSLRSQSQAQFNNWATARSSRILRIWSLFTFLNRQCELFV